MGALVGDDGTVIVDDGYAPMAPKLEAALKTISNKPVKYVFNTHWHGDHSAGNEYFGKFATVIGHDNVWKMKEMGGKLFAPSPASARPAITFSNQLTLHIDGGEIQRDSFSSQAIPTPTASYFSRRAKWFRWATTLPSGILPTSPRSTWIETEAAEFKDKLPRPNTY